MAEATQAGPTAAMLGGVAGATAVSLALFEQFHVLPGAAVAFAAAYAVFAVTPADPP